MKNKIKLEDVINKLHPEGFMKRSKFHSLTIDEQVNYVSEIVEIYTELNGPLRIGIANEKGGTGKTLVALNIAFMLGQFGLKTLLQDNDPQASSTSLTGADQETTKHIAFVKKIDTVPEVPEEYKDLDNFEPIDLKTTNINEEFGREHFGYSIDDALESMMDNDGIVDEEILEEIIVTPGVVTQAPEYDEQGRKKKNDEGFVVWTDEFKDYGFDVVPSSSGLFTYGVKLGLLENQMKLKNAVGFQLDRCMEQLIDYQNKKGNKYNVVISDLAPSLDIITLNGLYYCRDGIIGVITPNFEVLNGIYNIMTSIQFVMQNNIEHLGMPLIITNKYKSNYSFDKALSYDLIQKTFKIRAAQNRISLHEAATAQAHNINLMLSQYKAKPYEEFKKLTAEVLYEVLDSRIRKDRQL